MTDYNNMTLREELEARFKEADENKKEAEFLSRGWQPPSAANNDKEYSWGDIASQIYGATGDMIRNYIDMRRDNTQKADDYFHCKANYEAAARGRYGSEFARALGNEKEFFDYFYNQLWKGKTKEEAERDYYHDIFVNKVGRQQANSGLYSNSKAGCDIYRVNGINDRY